MEEQLVSFEVAKLAKEKGFKELTLSYYFEDSEFRENKLTGTNGYYGDEYCFEYEDFLENWNGEWKTSKHGDRCFGCNSSGYLETYSAPTLSLLQKWLLDLKKVYVLVIPTETMYWTYKILNLDYEIEQAPYKNVCAYDYSSYEEALENGILEALKSI